MQDRIRVAVVDDSALFRRLLRSIVDSQPDMVCVGAAADPYGARELIRALDPDVLTLDIDMPRMDGLEFLAHLMRLRPMPVLVLSSLAMPGSEAARRAEEGGAAQVLAKPAADAEQGLRGFALRVVEAIRKAARAPVAGRSAPAARSAGAQRLIAIGASTGGTDAIRQLLAALPPASPGIVIAQHMPAGFTRAFAQRLDCACRIRVKEAEHGETVLPGWAYIAPGDVHLRIDGDATGYRVALSGAPPVNRHRPSVDVLFGSVAASAGARGLGVILTGMGRDGARSMLLMRRAGAYTIAQDEASCVVFGMPKEAIAAGAVEAVLPLSRIAARLLERAAGAGDGTESGMRRVQAAANKGS